MFNKYGEFNSAEELNKAAAEKKAAGDTDSVMELARENGIEEENAKDFIDGCTEELCSPFEAAIGKLKIEREAIKLPGTMEGWMSMLQDMLLSEPELVKAVRHKGKKIVELFGKLLKISSTKRSAVPIEIVKAAGLTGSLFVGDVDIVTFKQTVKEYYLS